MSELAKNCELAVSSMARVVERLVAKGSGRRIVSGLELGSANSQRWEAIEALGLESMNNSGHWPGWHRLCFEINGERGEVVQQAG